MNCKETPDLLTPGISLGGHWSAVSRSGVSVLGDSMEEWRQVEGWPYEVSSLGRVRRTKGGRGARPWCIMKHRTDHRGYWRIRLSRVVGTEAQSKRVAIHHLVCHAFIGPRPDGYQCNHKNGVKIDNRPENLEWVTPGENSRHAVRMGLVSRPSGEDHPLSQFTNAQVLEIRRRSGEGERGVDLAEAFGTSAQSISRIIRRRAWRHLQ